METYDKNKHENLHVVPTLNEYRSSTGSNSGRPSSSNKPGSGQIEPIHKESCNIPNVAAWNMSCPQDGRDVLLQCPSPVVSTSDCNNSASEFSGEETDFDDLADLLRRFDTYFREKVDTELQSIGDFMHGMLSEQQIHLQQILNQSSVHTNKWGLQKETENDNVINMHAMPEQQPLEETEMLLAPVAETAEKYQRSATSEILLELMSLSCELSALLSQSKFL